MKFNARQIPLSGRHLIEASAGTGKTYSIANLFLRLLLEPHPSRADGKPLAINEILVVTFTNAATDELRGRIRRKIEDALNHFRFGGSGDEFIAHYQPDDPSLACQRLHEALLLMDDAAIYTIHGFATRLIQAFLFETGALADVEVMIGASPRRQQALDDLWRQLQLASVNDESLQEMLAWLDRKQLQWQAVASMRGEILPALEKTDRQKPWWKGLSAFVKRHVQLVQQSVLAERDALCLRWQDLRDDGEALDAVLLQPLPGQAYKRYSLSKFVDEIDRWLNARELLLKPPKNDRKDGVGGWGARYHDISVDSAARDTACHRFFLEIKAHLDRCADLDKPEQRFAKAFIAHELALRMKAYDPALLQPDDVIQLINDKLGDRHTEAALRRMVTNQYPVCMVDEFQDTDPEQFRLFDTLYSDSRHLGFYAIGDPKQSIYGFRGADIFAYLDVKSRTCSPDQQQTLHSLHTNYRSKEGVMRAVNALFHEPAGRQSDGKVSPVFFYEGIRYEAIDSCENPSDKSQVQQHKGIYRFGKKDAVPSLVFIGNQEAYTAFNNLLPVYAEDSAERIVSLLQGKQAATIEKVESGKQHKPVALKPGDIAVLVKNYREADAIKLALRRRNLQAVYLAQKDSVFKRCLFARDLLFVLRAMDEPASKRALKAAFATPLLRGFSSDCQVLDDLDNDDAFHEWAIERFTSYQVIWNKKGILPALNALISDPLRGMDSGLVGVFAHHPERDRLMTDFRHLGDLLQQQHLQCGSRELLMDWYAAQLSDDADLDEDSKSLRLESDADLIKIVTLHGCKGLEYPVVFMPFFFGFRDISLETEQPFYHRSLQTKNSTHWQAVLDYASSPGDVAVAMQQERMAEDMRLLYVGITRAIYQCYVGISASYYKKPGNPVFPKTAWAHVLGITVPEPDWETIKQALQQRLGDTPFASEEIKTDLTVFQPGAKDSQAVLQAPARIELPSSAWTITSYSSLAHQKEAPVFESQRHEDDAGLADGSMDEADEQHADNIRFRLRGGRITGDFFHKVFERLARENTERKQIIAEEAKRYTLPLADIAAMDTAMALQQINTWTTEVIQARLPQAETTLQRIFSGVSLPELRFDFSLGGDGRELSIGKINAVLTGACGAAAGIARRDGKPQLQGLMTGSIDLLFVCNQQVFVLDYKTNTLGHSPNHYNQESMTQAMCQNRFDLQYLIYSVAAHRYMQQRLGTQYDFDNGHYRFGGVYYLFLRGMGLKEYPEHGIWFHRPSRVAIEALDTVFKGEQP